MPLEDGYGVLKCKADENTESRLSRLKNHIEVLVKDGEGTKYRLAINIQSGDQSEVLYYVGEDFNSDQITHLPNLNYGYTLITRDNRDDIALDYIRGNLLIPKNMIPLPNLKPGPDNDLYEKVGRYISEAREKQATIYVYGEPWGPEELELEGDEERGRDPVFHFRPGRGIHNIHMNQGNFDPPFYEENGIWQDGGVLFHFEEENRWVAIFLAFQSQSWCTDDGGNPIKPVAECNHTTVGT
ncbi:hypothetical protein B9C88_22760 [Brevibacillus laterosporus]|uniref:YukJ family protein n=1 Tax=Brevibacillus laterosporus TaxID=1465 RepID=UPI000BD2211C|nr:YukJ family protein [Brevibacillus laterosporus]PCN42089.1 hypothetical protein B9C88_22760 [Brevibacillus laterosporus]